MTADRTAAADDPFWAAAAEGRLSFQRCDGCGFIRWPAAGVCPECLCRSATWTEVDGTGTLWSYVVYHRAYASAGIPPVPYNVALVELDCGPRLLTRLAETGPGVEPGARVTVRFEDDPVYGAIPVFAPIGEPA